MSTVGMIVLATFASFSPFLILIGIIIFINIRKKQYKEKFKKYDFIQKCAEELSEKLIKGIKAKNRDSRTKRIWCAMEVYVGSTGIYGFSVDKHNMKPFGIIQRSAIRELLSEMIIKNVEEYLAKNPMDSDYSLSRDGDRILYSAKNSAYIPPKSW